MQREREEERKERGERREREGEGKKKRARASKLQRGDSQTPTASGSYFPWPLAEMEDRQEVEAADSKISKASKFKLETIQTLGFEDLYEISKSLEYLYR